MSLAIRRRLAAWGFLTPMLLGIIIFFIFPLVMTVYYSFTSYNMLSPPKWNNFANWKHLFGNDQVIGKATLNTLWFVVVLVPVRIVGALFVSWMLTKARRAGGVFRTIYYLPALIPPVASTVAFVFVLNPGSGPIASILGWGPIKTVLSWVGFDNPGFFADSSWAKPAHAFLALWVLGDIMVIILASLLNVPTEQYEAAEIDGAGAARRFWYVTIPNIRPVLLFATITGIIAVLQYFTQPSVASATASGNMPHGAGAGKIMGWPENSTLTYGQLLYQNGFSYHNLGYASTMAVMLFLVAGVVMFFLLRRFSDFNPEVAS